MRDHWFIRLGENLKLKDGSTLKTGTLLRYAGVIEDTESPYGASTVALLNGKELILRDRYDDACPVDSRGREI
jgi:hypothetical protein